jgi:uncharacterized membrane protein
MMPISHEPKHRLTKFRGAGSTNRSSPYDSVVPLPLAFLIPALVSDLMFYRTYGAFWWEASKWLLAAGLATSAYAAGDGLIQRAVVGAGWRSRMRQLQLVGNLLAALLTLANLVYRVNEDQEFTLVPAGSVLTAIAGCLVICMARLKRDVAARALQDEQDSAYRLWDELAANDGFVDAEGEAPLVDFEPRPAVAQFRLRIVNPKFQDKQG